MADTTKKISQNRQKKEDLVQNLAKKLADSKSVAITDYRGLTVHQISELRGKIREKKAELTVIKNTLLKLALKKAGLILPEGDALEGPTATLISYEDEVTALKELDNFAKTNSLPTIKAGYLGSEMLSGDAISKLAKLPTKEVLHGQVIGALASPIYGVVSVLQANIRNLVYVLSQVQKQK